MANYYTSISFEVDNLDRNERRWLERRVSLDIDEGNGLQRMTRMAQADGMAIDVDYWPGFGWAFGKTNGCASLWIHSDDSVNMTNVVELIKAFLRRYRAEQQIVIGYAESSSKSLVDSFGGGAVLVTAKDDIWFDGVSLAQLYPFQGECPLCGRGPGEGS